MRNRRRTVAGLAGLLMAGALVGPGIGTAAAVDDTGPQMTVSQQDQVAAELVSEGVSSADAEAVASDPVLAAQVAVGDPTVTSGKAEVAPTSEEVGAETAASGLVATTYSLKCWNGWVRSVWDNFTHTVVLTYYMYTHWCSGASNVIREWSSTFTYKTSGGCYAYDHGGPGWDYFNWNHHEWVRWRSGVFTCNLYYTKATKTVGAKAYMWGDGTFNWGVWTS